MPVLFVTHEIYLDHIAGRNHPERPERLGAVIDGSRDAAIADELIPLMPRAATMTELQRVHPLAYLQRLDDLCRTGGGRLDPDTAVSEESFDAAVLAAGAGLAAIEALQSQVHGAEAAFCAVRPPGHHATATTSMGFCLISNVAVVAAHLAAQGERVVIVDYDAHHGNGTQDIFYSDPNVLYISLHQWPLYPGTGAHDEIGDGAGWGTTVNVPLPMGATGDVYLAATDDLIGPAIEHFGPTWMIISAGFDAHRDDPITDLGLSSGDFAVLTARLVAYVQPGRVLMMLEGGYHLDALRHSSAAALGALGRIDYRPERLTNGGPGLDLVTALRAWRDQQGLA